MDQKTIKQIVANLAKEGMSISEANVMEALKDSNLQTNKMLHNLSEKVNAERSDSLGKDDTRSNIIKEDAKNKSKHDDIYKNVHFKNKYTKKSQIANYHRISELPRYTEDQRVDRMIEDHNNIKSLSLELAELERDQPLQQDEQFVVILDEKEGNFLKSIQNSIGSANEFKRKYNVVKATTKSGGPSIDLLGKTV